MALVAAQFVAELAVEREGEGKEDRGPEALFPQHAQGVLHERGGVAAVLLLGEGGDIADPAHRDVSGADLDRGRDNGEAGDDPAIEDRDADPFQIRILNVAGGGPLGTRDLECSTTDREHLLQFTASGGPDFQGRRW